jgi:hypothetical protein
MLLNAVYCANAPVILSISVTYNHFRRTRLAVVRAVGISRIRNTLTARVLGADMEVVVDAECVALGYLGQVR